MSTYLDSVTHLENGFPVFKAPAESSLYGLPANKPDTTDLVSLIVQSRAERDANNLTAIKADE